MTLPLMAVVAPTAAAVDRGTLPATVWVNVSDSGPDAVGFSTFHLDVTR